MSFWLVEALHAGNALRLYLTPPVGAETFKLLRRSSGIFSGIDDPGADVVVEGSVSRSIDGEHIPVLDASGLVNGTEYFYRVYWDGDELLYDDTSGTPAADYVDGGADALEVVLSRLKAGMAVEVLRGELSPGKGGSVPVLNAWPIWDQTPFPCVSIHLDQASQGERGAGEIIDPDVELLSTISESEGYIERVRLSIIGWELNPDARIALRKALRRVINANLPVFADFGIALVDWPMRDAEDLERYSAPVYEVVVDFSCVVCRWVSGEVDKVSEVTVEGEYL